MEDNPKSHRQQPDNTPESAGTQFSPLNGEDIIDLTDIVAPMELEGQTTTSREAVEMVDDDIIELTDIVPSADSKAQGFTLSGDTNGADEDDIIELIDIVDPAQRNTRTGSAVHEAVETVEDDIIDLTDIVQPVEPETQTFAASNETGGADEDDIIELIDIVEPGQQDAEPIPAVHEAVETVEDDIIDLTDIVQPVEPETQGLTTSESRGIDENEQEISGRLPDKDVYYETQNQSLEDTLSELEAMMDDTFSGEALDLGVEEAVGQENAGAEDRAVETSGEGTFDDFPIGMAIAGERDDDETDETSGAISASLTAAQIDAAVERLILAKFGQTIEQMVATSIEKFVTREIETIRQALLEDEDAME